MRALIVGLVLGLILGVLGTLGVQYLRQHPEKADAERTVQLFEVVPVVMERALPGIRVLDVALQTPATQTVSYEHDALYDAHIKYQLNGRIERVILPFGFTKGAVIFPNTAPVWLVERSRPCGGS